MTYRSEIVYVVSVKIIDNFLKEVISISHEKLILSYENDFSIFSLSLLFDAN
jgi:hypothetical protein